MKAWIRHWGPAIFFMAVIFLISGTPGPDLPDFGGWDLLTKKGGHMLGYAILASAYYYAIIDSKRMTKLHAVLAIFLTILYAASDEWHQKFIPGRNSSLIDVGIDTIGGLIGIGIFHLAWKNVRSRNAEAGTSPK